MSRVDKPELRCDRCKVTTLDVAEMGRFQRVSHSHMGGSTEWDLCPECWPDFIGFLANDPVDPRQARSDSADRG